MQTFWEFSPHLPLKCVQQYVASDHGSSVHIAGLIIAKDVTLNSCSFSWKCCKLVCCVERYWCLLNKLLQFWVMKRCVFPPIGYIIKLLGFSKPTSNNDFVVPNKLDGLALLNPLKREALTSLSHLLSIIFIGFIIIYLLVYRFHKLLYTQQREITAARFLTSVGLHRHWVLAKNPGCCNILT